MATAVTDDALHIDRSALAAAAAMQRLDRMVLRYGYQARGRYAALRQQHDIAESVRLMEEEFPL
jgi:hypothetical protein